MYVYQDGKLYAEIEGNKLVGVDIYSDKVLIVEGSETERSEAYDVLLPIEARARFIIDGEPYLFPREDKVNEQKIAEKGVVDNVTVGEVKKSTRKSSGK